MYCSKISLLAEELPMARQFWLFSFCTHSVYATISSSNVFSMVFDKKDSKHRTPTMIFYSNITASYLSTITRNHANVASWRKTEKWQNVQSAEPKSPNRRRRGKWQEDQISKENGCNSKSRFMTARKATVLSEKS